MAVVELPAAVHAVAVSQGGVITRAQALSCGLTPERWRSGAAGQLAPVFRGCAVLSHASEPDGPSARQLGQAAILVVGNETGTLCLGSALRLYGIDGSPFKDPEHVLTTSGGHSRPGLVRHQFLVRPRSVCTLDGIRVTTPLRSVFDAVRSYDRAHAVSVMDSALHQGFVSPDELAGFAPYLSLERRAWIDLADPKAESPFESRTRLLFVAGRVSFQSQYAVQLPAFGNVRLDFLVGRRTGVECDGKKVHDPIAARYADSARDEALRDVGIEVVHLAWRDVEANRDEVLRRIARSEARAAGAA